MPSSVIPAATMDLPAAELDPAQVVEGSPAVSALDVLTTGDLTIGVWEHTAGTSTDVESDEVFVVLTGRASVAVEGGSTLELRPGDIGVLEAGARTTWTVRETLRKVYLVGGPAQEV
jgi:uncharacterized protein